jgi:UBX domain
MLYDVVFNSIPISKSPETTLGPELTTRLRFKFPTGKFVNQKFPKKAKISDLFSFLKQTGETKPFEVICCE